MECLGAQRPARVTILSAWTAGRRRGDARLAALRALPGREAFAPQARAAEAVMPEEHD